MDERHEHVDQDEQDEQNAKIGKAIMDKEIRDEIDAEDEDIYGDD